MAKVAIVVLVALCAAFAAAAPKDDFTALMKTVQSSTYKSMMDDNAQKMTNCILSEDKGKAKAVTDVLDSCYTSGWMQRQQGTGTVLGDIGNCILSDSPSDALLTAAISFIKCTSNAYKS